MLTPLEQFNEEVMKEMNEKIVPATVRKFFIQKLTEQKELILEMVREKAPGTRTIDKLFVEYPSLSYCESVQAWNACRQEFLNNLDTI